MKDSINRNINYLRLSVTKRCQLRCIYCCENKEFKELKEELSLMEIKRIVSSMAKLGVVKVRITGGEPLIRSDIIDIVRCISSINGINEVAITTNGILLKDKIKDLIKAGVTSFNISLDTLNPEKYKMITRGGDIFKVVSAIEALLKEQHLLLSRGENLLIKVNVVLIKGINDDEIDDFIELTHNSFIDVRFIELMPMNNILQEEKCLVKTEKILEKRPNLIKIEPRYYGQPSVDYKIPGYRGRVGFISPMTHQFCKYCNRVRVLSNGYIRPCLGNNLEISLKDALSAEDDTALVEIIRNSVKKKNIKHSLKGSLKSIENMNEIGG